MKICLLTYEYPRSSSEAIVSGEVKNSYYLCRGLASAGHDLTVVSVPFLTRRPKRPHERRQGGETVFDVPEGRGRSALRYVLRIRNVAEFFATTLRDTRFDVVHAESPALAAGAARGMKAAGGRGGTPIVTTAHGTYLPEALADRDGSRLRYLARSCSNRLTRRIDQRAFRASDVTIAASEYQRAELEELYGVDPASLVVIHNGVDIDLYRPDGPRSGLIGGAGRSEEPTILFVGRLVPKKGLQHLISAFPRVLAKAPRARCVVVGGSKAFDTFGRSLRILAESAGVSDRVAWLRDVPEPEMPALYRSADVAVFPSVGYESLPTVVLEAMACGTPVVATNGWAIPEALGPAHPGLAAEADPESIADRVLALLSDPSLRERARAIQLERVRAFSLDRVVARHEELYSRVVAGG